MGTFVLSSENYDNCYLQAQRVRRLIKNDFDDAFKQVDIILTPSATGEAFAMNAKLSPLEMYMNDIFTIPASLAGMPCMSIPVGLSSGGLPLGMQLITKHFDEELMLKAAHFIETNINYKNIYKL
jgi:aspartyl-tRNA(Asn)/glutamyl-tRNA(Gln) amidotransferase subunit A